ncbi:MAG: tetratricopeptide repeat protein, partial [Saccharothrix sp.]|nr:tetratricopeptide repeat protein [Saccharothrix sp.]
MVGVLGELEVRLGDRLLPMGHARQRAVMVALAAQADHVVPVDNLIDRVWSERPPKGVRSALRAYLSHLRRALAPTGVAITRHGGGYALRVSPENLDLHRFGWLVASAREQRDPRRAVELVEEALALWRGSPIAELDTPWARSLRERLHHERAAAEADHLDWALACGRHHELLPDLTTRAEVEPLDERTAGQLMLALYRSGRQAEALTHYQRVRRRLVEEVGADPGQALQALHQRILTADPALTAPASGGRATATATTGPVVPRQLPAAPRSFTGRVDDLAALDTALDDQGTVVISVIGGPGGIGKTWLALTWAHRHLERFPDGQLFVDLRGFSPDSEPMDPAAAVRGFLDALGVDPTRVPTDPHAQSARYRDLLAGKRMLIMLDNAATADQVVPLLPSSPTCTVLITSRHRLPALIARHGAQPLSLDVLPDAESHALLTATLGADRGTTDERATDALIALCGGFPLALGLIAARVQPHLSLDDAVAELRGLGLDALDSEDPAASLPAVLSWSLRRLTRRQRTVFALLGVAPGSDIGLPAAANLTNLSAPETHAVLRALVDASLIDVRPGVRYAMHDLVRSYAANLAHDLPEPDRNAALERVMDFHLHTAHAADRLLDPHSTLVRLDPPAPGVDPHPLPDAAAATAWLDTEHATLLATQRAAGTLGRHHVVWHLAWSLDGFHRLRGLRLDGLASWRAALDATAHLSDAATHIRTHRLLGNACSRLGLHEEATGHLDRALALAVRHRDHTEQAFTHQQLALAWERRGDDERALDHARNALDLHRTLDQPTWEASALNAVGWYAARLGDFDTARDHCRAALVLHRRNHHSAGEANTLDSLGFIAHRTGDHLQAIDYYHQALV